MSALTDRIAAEHFVRSGAFYVTTQRWEDVCACGERFPTGGIRAHIAAVTEAAVREQVARETEPVHNHGPRDGRGLNCPETVVNGRLRGACMDGAA